MSLKHEEVKKLWCMIKKPIEEQSNFCGYPDDTEFNTYGGPCDEEHCKNRYKFKWETFHLLCKYRNRDYGPPSGVGKP